MEGYHYYPQHYGGESSYHQGGSGDGRDRKGGGGDKKKPSKLDLFRPEKRAEKVQERQEGLQAWFHERTEALERQYTAEIENVDKFTSRISERVIERNEIAVNQKARLEAVYRAMYDAHQVNFSTFANDMAQFGFWAENSTRFEYYTGLDTRPLKKSVEKWEGKKASVLSSQAKTWSDVTAELRDERRPERVEAINISLERLRVDLDDLKRWGDYYAGIEHGKIDDWVRSGSGRAAAAGELRGHVNELYDKYNQRSTFDSKLAKVRDKNYTSEEQRKQVDLKAFEDLIDRYRTDADGLEGSRAAEWGNLGADLEAGRQSFERQQQAEIEAEQQRQWQAQYGGYQQDDFGGYYYEE